MLPVLSLQLGAAKRRELLADADAYRLAKAARYERHTAPGPRRPERVRWARRLPIDRRGLRDVAPVLVGIAPFALVIGVRIADQHVSHAGSLSGALLLYAGSAHLSVLTLLAHGGASTLSVLATVAVINARFMVYGAALAPRFAGQPRWFRWTAPHFIVDQTFGLVMARHDLDNPGRFRRYWFTVAGAIAVVWVAAMTVGVVLGTGIPHTAPVAFMPICLFVGLLVPALTERPAVAAALTAAAVAALLPVSAGTRILAATLAGVLAGHFTESARS